MSESDLMALADLARELTSGHGVQTGSGAVRIYFNGFNLSEFARRLRDRDNAEVIAAADSLRRLASGARETGEAVAFVPVHPRTGPLWAETFAVGSEWTERRSINYPRMALYATPPSPAREGETGEAVANCGNCRRYRSGTCRFGPPVRLPRRFASEATAESRVRDETLYWGWPTVDVTDWCDEHIATPLRDPTAQTSPLTKGQQIVDDYERDVIAQPCELAQAIDDAIAAVTPAREERLREALEAILKSDFGPEPRKLTAEDFLQKIAELREIARAAIEAIKGEDHDCSLH